MDPIDASGSTQPCPHLSITHTLLTVSLCAGESGVRTLALKLSRGTKNNAFTLFKNTSVRATAAQTMSRRVASWALVIKPRAIDHCCRA